MVSTKQVEKLSRGEDRNRRRTGPPDALFSQNRRLSLWRGTRASPGTAGCQAPQRETGFLHYDKDSTR